jgi:hypothetical protein
MKRFLAAVLAALCLSEISGAYGKTNSVDAFQACMNRTKSDRINCEAGCGMIIQQCYDEGISDINDKVKRTEELLRQKNGDVCANFADGYLQSALHMEADLQEKTGALPGWAGSELALNLARQRLDNVRLLLGSCIQ